MSHTVVPEVHDFRVIPSNLVFQDLPPNSGAGAEVTVSNDADTELQLLELSTTTTDFEVASTDCSSALPAHSTCLVAVQFQGATSGQRTGALKVVTDRGTKLVSLAASVSASTSGELFVSPNTIDFGEVDINTGPRAIPVQVRNSGEAPVADIGVSWTTTSPAITADASGCSTLGPEESCNIEVWFEPSAAGTYTASFTVVSNADTDAPAVSISGRATSAIIEVASNTADNIQAWKGGAPVTGSFTLLNSGSSAAHLELSELPAPFSLDRTSCDLAPAAACTVTVTFSPSETAGTHQAVTVNVTGANFEPLAVPVSGTTLSDEVVIVANTAASLVLPYGMDMTSGYVQVRNHGNTPVTLTFSGLSAPFSLAYDTCTLAAGAACTVDILLDGRELPGGTIPSQTLLISGSTVSGTLEAPVGGAVNAAAFVLVSSNLESMEAPKGTAPGQGQAVFRNDGSASGTLSFQLVPNGVYQLSTTSCTLEPGQTCAVTVSFSAEGPPAHLEEARLLVTSSGGSVATPELDVRGTVLGAVAQLTNNAKGIIGYYGEGDATGTLVLTNTGTSVGTFTVKDFIFPVSATPSSCTLDPGQSCEVTVTLDGSTVRGVRANFTVTGSAAGNIKDYIEGWILGTVAVRTTPASVTLSTEVGAAPAYTSVTFRNDGNQMMTLSPSALPAPLSIANNSCTNVAPSSQCSVLLVLGSSQAGSGSAKLTMTGASIGPDTTTINWEVANAGFQPSQFIVSPITVTTTDFDFEATFTVTNNTGQTLTVTSLGVADQYEEYVMACLGSNCTSRGDIPGFRNATPASWAPGQVVRFTWDDSLRGTFTIGLSNGQTLQLPVNVGTGSAAPPPTLTIN